MLVMTDLRVWMLMRARTDPGVSGPELDGVIIPSRRQYKLKMEIILITTYSLTNFLLLQYGP